MTSVATYSYAHSATYVSDNILKSLKDIIRHSGLDPTDFVNSTSTYRNGIEAWLNSRHLEKVVLEIYNPSTNALIVRWDIEIVYGWSGGDGSFWTDTDQLKYAILKTGVSPSSAKYSFIVTNKPGAPAVSGWSSVDFRSTEGMTKQTIGNTIEHSGLGTNTAYWRR